MWILFLYSNLSKAKSLVRLHIFISIVSTLTHVLFNLTDFRSTCAKKLFLNNVTASLCWTCQNHLKRFSFNLSHILSNEDLSNLRRTQAKNESYSKLTDLSNKPKTRIFEVRFQNLYFSEIMSTP